MLTEFFGNYPRIRVMELLLSNPYSEFSKTDIAESSRISRNTLYNFFGKLEEYNLIKPGKKFGNTQLFKVNKESSAIKALNAFQLRLAEIEIEKQIEIYDNEENTDDGEELGKIFALVDEKIDEEIFQRQENQNIPELVSSTCDDLFDEKIKIEIFNPSHSSQILYKQELFFAPSTTYQEDKQEAEIKTSSDS